METDHFQQAMTLSTNPESEPSALEAWLTMIALVVAGALHVKAPMLWSESRMLRKLQSRTRPQDLLNAVSATKLDQVFSELYMSLSKGRHRRLSRMYRGLYLLFIVFMDVSGDLLEVNVLNSEALLALRVVVYFGAFAVLGARAFSVWESTFICGLVVGNAGVLLAFSYGWIVTSARTVRIVTVTRAAYGMITVVSIGVDLILACACRGTEVAQIANSIRRERLGDGTRQAERLSYMKELSGTEPNSTRGQTGGRYWRPSVWNWVDMSGVVVLTATTGAAWGEVGSNKVATIVILESLELLSNVLFFFNETQVEPRLFFELMKLSKTETL